MLGPSYKAKRPVTEKNEVAIIFHDRCSRSQINELVEVTSPPAPDVTNVYIVEPMWFK